jgi:prepilin-type N-terminal cleavage/methylation domain-containing protein
VRRAASHRQSGFTLVEMIVVSLLLLVAMLGLLAVFDASARINKNETDVADAQGSVRYGIYQMTRVIRMAGAGGLYLTQAVLNQNDASMLGVLPAGVAYDNVGVVTVTDTDGNVWVVRPGTDMIEIRGVINSPLLAFEEGGIDGCSPCTGSETVIVNPVIGNATSGQHVNNDATNRPQFSVIDDYTTGVTATDPMFVIVEDGKFDLHSGCSEAVAGGAIRYPQPPYNVGVITSPTDLAGGSSMGVVNFGSTIAQRLNAEMPSDGSQPGQALTLPRRVGILDDILFFVALDPVAVDPLGQHPFLAQGIRRGDAYEVTRLAEDVEDMQVAYGIDGIVAGIPDNAVTRDAGCAIDPATDPDPNFSTVSGCDEWVPNVTGETAPDPTEFQLQNPYVAGHPGSPPPNHCPRLHGVMISLLAKARDSDPTYRGPAAQGYQLMNSTATPVTPGNYRRRVQTMKINLRNFAFQG